MGVWSGSGSSLALPRSLERSAHPGLDAQRGRCSKAASDCACADPVPPPPRPLLLVTVSIVTLQAAAGISAVVNAASALKGPGGKECFGIEAKSKDKVTGHYSPLKGISLPTGVKIAFESVDASTRGIYFGFVFLRQGLL